MKISKHVDVEVEVDVYVDIEDIARAVVEHREKVKPAMFSAINNFFNFMGQMPDEIVADCNESQTKIITGFFDTQSARFKTAEQNEITAKFKDHELAALVNEVTKQVKAVCPDAPQCLREVIARSIKSSVKARAQG